MNSVKIHVYLDAQKHTALYYVVDAQQYKLTLLHCIMALFVYELDHSCVRDTLVLPLKCACVFVYVQVHGISVTHYYS